MKNLVLTEQSILTIANTITPEIVDKGLFPNSEYYTSINIEDFTVILTGNDKDKHLDSLPFIILNSSFFSEDLQIIKEALFSIHSAVISFNQAKNLRKYIPNKKFTQNNLLVLDIYQHYIYILVNANDNGAFYIFHVSSKLVKDINPENYNLGVINQIEKERSNIVQTYKDMLEHKQLLLSDNYNFDLFFADKDQQYYSLEDWRRILTNKQLAFLDKKITNRLKLLGPAGTGKTLLMELKIVDLLQNSNSDLHILFTCHSWSVAIQVSEFLSNIDPEIGNKVDVFPLLALAQDRTADKELNTITLGDDSYSGKIEQIKILNQIIQDYKKKEWKILKDSCTSEFIKRMESVDSKNNNFTWDIMIEISSTICANGIMDEPNGFEKYCKIERQPWMLPLENDSEKKTIYNIYTRLMEKLDNDNTQTSDMIFNDYLNYLAGYSWNKKRKIVGYDYIFIDEMQLFNVQEKAVLNYLMRNPKEYPKIVMAMDPKQSVDMIYSDYGVTETYKGFDIGTDTDKEIRLDEAFRYTRRILVFLKHIDLSYPELGFGGDWNNNIKNIDSKQGEGVVPFLYECTSGKEIQSAMKIAEKISNKRIAILTLQDSLFVQFQNEVVNNSKYKIIDAMGKSHALKYVRQNIYVSKPSYVIGLQFDVVILVGCYSIFNQSVSNISFYKRRYLSDLYLGASRAKSGLYLIADAQAPSVPNVIQTALEKKCLQKISKV